MFYTPKEKGLNQEQINDICERLWEERLDTAGNCNDCGAKPGEKHNDGCDVAICTSCGEQLICCDCEDGEPDVWSGIWPGIKECYEQKLICFSTGLKEYGVDDHWRFNLNKLYEKK